MSGLGVAIWGMYVAGGGFKWFVAKEDLNGSGVSALFGQVGGKAVSEAVSAGFNTHA